MGSYYELPPERVDRMREVVLDEAVGHPRPHRRRRTVLVASAAAGAVALGGAAVAWMSAQRPADDYLAYCAVAETADPGQWRRHAVGAASDAEGGRAPVAAVRICEQLWRMGELGRATDVPKLTPCVVEGQLVVFPGDAQVCRRVGGVPALVSGT